MHELDLVLIRNTSLRSITTDKWQWRYWQFWVEKQSQTTNGVADYVKWGGGSPPPPFYPLHSLLRNRTFKIQLGGLGNRRKLPIGIWAEPWPKLSLVHHSVKMWDLVATISTIFTKINWPNLVQFKLVLMSCLGNWAPCLRECKKWWIMAWLYFFFLWRTLPERSRVHDVAPVRPPRSFSPRRRKTNLQRSQVCLHRT